MANSEPVKEVDQPLSLNLCLNPTVKRQDGKKGLKNGKINY